MHHLDLILTLTGGLTAALVCGYVTQRLGLSPIVGYLLAGVAIGPFTAGLSVDREIAAQFSEVGVVLLMFGVGLHFHLEDLLAVRKVAVPGAALLCSVATASGMIVAHEFGWNWSAALVFGLALSVESTVVLTRVLSDRNELHTPTGHLAVGWLVVEDLFTVVMLVLLPTLVGKAESGGAAAVPLAVGVSLLKIGSLVAFTLLVGGRVIPKLLERMAKARSRELFTLTVLVVALGIAVGSAKLFGVSMALGAFLAGMVVGRSEFSLRAASEALPMRDAFAVLFFVSVGMLFDPTQLLRDPWLIAAALGIVVLLKPLAAFFIVLLLRRPPRTAFGIAAALSQIGEFSFLVGQVGIDLGVLSKEATNALVGASIISITLSPVLYRAIGPFEAWAARRPRLWKLLNMRVSKGGADDADARPRGNLAAMHRSVVIGYGPVGRTVSRLLLENDIEPSIVEMNLDTVRQLRRDGVRAVYGDASRRETLQEAGIAEAGSLILSAGGVNGSEEVIRLARELNPRIRVLARTTYVRELAALRAAGAEAVFSGEGEIALGFTEAVLRGLGATPDQIDRERERVRGELGTLNVAGPAAGVPAVVADLSAGRVA